MSDTRPSTFLESSFPTFYQVARNWSARAKPGEIVDASNLPESLKEITRQFVSQSRLRRKSGTKLARVVVSHFDKQLAQGITVETLANQWRDAVPLTGVLQLNEPSLLTLHSLPKSVADLIVRVVRRTRLWRREQIDVASELISHFQEGIDAGVPESALVQSFGDIATATRLICRAKMRNRPLVWKMYRLAYQFAGVALLAFIIVWFCLWVRYQFAKPNVKFDYIGILDAKSKAIPESDRAWPLYAEAITKSVEAPHGQSFPAPAAANGRLLPEWNGLAELLDVQRVDGRAKQTWIVTDDGVGAPEHVENVQREYRLNMDAYSKALNELRKGIHWPALVQLAEMNQQSIQLALEASNKPHFGFIYRDPANATWLNSKYSGSYQHFEESTETLLTNVLLPHIQDLSSFHRLLLIECERAAESGDRERVVEILSAFLRISEQIYHSDEFAVEKLVAIAFSKRCWFMVRKIVNEQSNFFTDNDLRDLAHRMAAYRSAVGLQIPADSQAFTDDLLQRLYTDDSRGNGFLTSAGTLLLLEQVGLNQGTRPVQGREWNGPFPLAAPLISGVTVSRAELKQVLDHCAALDQREASKPLWETLLDRTPASVEYLQQITSTTTGCIKYGMLRSVYPFRALTDSNASAVTPAALVLHADSAKMLSDAAQVAIALEAYHRRHGTWPDQLGKLCPDILPSVPLDRFDGKPMKYKLVDNNPLVYSVGRNRVDDGGVSIIGKADGFESDSGDWRLWPVAVGGQ